MKNLDIYFYDCYYNLVEGGYPVGDIQEVKINTRAQTRWGQCRYNRYMDSYTIEISSRLLADEVKDEALEQTIYHELLHTCPNCMNHGEVWKGWAQKVKTDFGIDIERTTSAAEKGVAPVQSKEDYHYFVTCANCNTTWKYKRHSKIVSCCENNNAKCSCGGQTFTVSHV